VLLLDEITVDLDVLARADFLKFLIEDCETRGMTVVYVSPTFMRSLPLVALPRLIKRFPFRWKTRHLISPKLTGKDVMDSFFFIQST
jgi:hypothetical protein